METKYLTAGAGWEPLDTPVGRLGVMVCLESIYPDIGRALTSAGAELLLVMSNDAGFGESLVTHHMTNRAVVRAVENGRWLLRAGQAGVSTLVDPRGRIHGRLGLFETGLLTGTARLRSDETLYVRWGDWWMGLVGGVLLLAFAASVRRLNA